MRDPKYKKPGARSVAGSGLEATAHGVLSDKVGSFAEPGFDSDPSGASQVTYQAGASTPVLGAYPAGKSGMAALTYSED